MPHNGWLKDYNHAERLLWQNPDTVLQEIGLKPGNTLVDIGCGDGFFAIPAARMVGGNGKVYALDVSMEPIAGLKSQADEAGLSNIQAIVGDAEEYIFCQRCVDVGLLANVLHDFKSPLKVLANAKTMLKPGGILADLDWKKEPGHKHGPPLAKRLSQDEAAALLNQAGFKVLRQSLSGPYHYLLLAGSAR